jgi:hypothetical protein
MRLFLTIIIAVSILCGYTIILITAHGLLSRYHTKKNGMTISERKECYSASSETSCSQEYNRALDDELRISIYSFLWIIMPIIFLIVHGAQFAKFYHRWISTPNLKDPPGKFKLDSKDGGAYRSKP